VGLFVHNSIENKEKLVWIDLLKCEESYYDRLSQLQIYKAKCMKQNSEYHKTQKEINDIQNKIRLDQIKVKIKVKIQKKRNVNLIRTID
jgi:predicted patatin/cPLA2 family phospholipase